MSNNLFANLKAYADLKRNPFNLDNKQTYSMKLGEITPVKVFHTIPGDFFKLNVSDKNLSFPMNTSAFLSARKEMVAYHVPYNHICSLFNQIQASRPDPKTSALSNTGDLHYGELGIPLVDLYSAVFCSFIQYIVYKYTNPREVNGSFELSSSASAGSFVQVLRDGNDILITYFQPSGTPWSYTLSNVFASVYGGSFDDGSGLANASDWVFGDGIVGNSLYDILGRVRTFNWVRKLDMLGYGNLYPALRMCENKISDLVEADTTELHLSQSTYSDIADYLNELYCTLLRMCFANARFTRHGSVTQQGIPTYDLSSVGGTRKVSVYPICSYNKCFYEFFRNSIYDLDYNVKNYNIDFAYIDNADNYQLHLSMFDLRFLDIEYHQYKKDIFTGSFPSAQFGAVSGISVTTALQTSPNREYFFGNNGVPTNGAASFTDGQLTDVGSHEVTHSHTITSGLLFNVLDLKRAEMLQNYRQTLLRNGNKTSDIFKGIYGKAPASEDDNSPRFIDTFGSNIFVDTIVSTADTAESGSYKGALGDLGARATINGGGRFTFKTSDFGCLLFLAYIVPENEYGSLMLDEHLTALDPETHFLPFFQNLGFTPVTNQHVNLYLQDNNTRGFVPSYWKFKQELSLAHGNFVALSRKNTMFDPRSIDDFVGSFNHWVALKDDMQNSDVATLAQFYVSPSMWDNVFIQQANEDYDSDHFICRTFFNVDSVRVLSKLGLPNF